MAIIIIPNLPAALCSIKLEMEWIPRTKNELTDYASRIVDLDDWLVSPNVFSMINSMWGPHAVDRFASPCNA